MNPADLHKINYNMQLIVDDVDSKHVVNHLISKGVLDVDDDEDIRAERTRKEKIELLLDKVTDAGPDAYKYFRESLAPNYSHIVIKLDSTPMDAGNTRGGGATLHKGGNMDLKFAERNRNSTKSIEITGNGNRVFMTGGSINFYNGRTPNDYM